MPRREGFTLIEIVISISILVLLLLLALPSMSGVIANRRLKRTLDAMNEIVRTAQERSVTERRAYIIEWQKRLIVVHPESPREGDPDGPTTTLALEKGYAYTLRMPAALEKGPFAQWIFWPSGTCEPATVKFKGPPGSWEVNYAPLTARPQIASYVTK